MSEFDFDLYVIGAGSGGVRASRVASSMGKRVAVAESGALGGTCVNVGCVPKKLFSYASHFHQEFEDAKGFGWSSGTPEFDWRTLLANKNREIERLNGIYANLLDSAGVVLHHGRAELLDAHTVETAGQRHSAENILIAVGGHPSVPEIPGAELGITSDEAFYLEELPEEAVVVGGGYIGVEFAGIFNGLGVDTTLLYRGDLFLRGFDNDVRIGLVEEMERKGVDLRFNQVPVSIKGEPGALEVEVETHGEGTETISTGLVLFATGRVPNVDGLYLERAKGPEGEEIMRHASGSICVDEFSRTDVPSIWAIGDVTDRLNLTPVAIHEAMCLTETLYGDKPVSPDHDVVATAVFSDPEIATVGLTEEEAREKFSNIEIYRSKFRPMRYTLTDNQEKTMMKLVVDADSDRIVGLHVLGRDGAELVQGAAIAIKMGATKADFDRTMGIHPTSGEELVTMTTLATD